MRLAFRHVDEGLDGATAVPPVLRRWLPFWTPSAAASVRLLCFHHAGGNAAAFRTWPQLLPPWVEVCAVQLPGRATRATEPLETSPVRLLDSLERGLASLLSGPKPVALFGHSMGATLAYGLATRLRESPPSALIVAARRAPTAAPQRLAETGLTDAALTDYLRRLGGTPPVLFSEPEFLAHVLEVLRADLLLNAAAVAEGPIRCGITVLGGAGDKTTPASVLDGWRALAVGPFVRRELPGGHFFTQESPAEVRVALLDALEGAGRQ